MENESLLLLYFKYQRMRGSARRKSLARRRRRLNNVKNQPKHDGDSICPNHYIYIIHNDLAMGLLEGTFSHSQESSNEKLVGSRGI